MNATRTAIAALSLLCLPVGIGAAPPTKVVEIRQHAQVVSAKNEVIYEFTEVTRFGDDFDESVVLVHDEGHGDFVMRRSWTFSDQAVTHRISDLKDAAFIQHTFKMPYISRTRRETLDEARKNPTLEETPLSGELETNGGKWGAMEADWEDAAGIDLRRLRHAVRQSLDSRLLEAIERMRGSIFTTPAGLVFYAMIGRLVLYDGSDNARIAALTTRDVAPDCAFDAAFGYKCSEKQLQRVADAAKRRVKLKSY